MAANSFRNPLGIYAMASLFLLPVYLYASVHAPALIAQLPHVGGKCFECGEVILRGLWRRLYPFLF